MDFDRGDEEFWGYRECKPKIQIFGRVKITRVMKAGMIGKLNLSLH